MHDEDFAGFDGSDGFDRSAICELLAPAVADRGLTSAPTDAIVAAGRRRVVGRRTAVAGGALAIVAAVPLAASAIAAGPGAAGTMSASSGGSHGASGAAYPALTQHVTSGTPAKASPIDGPAGLPAKPYVMASGTVENRTWSVTAEQTPGNNTLTAGDKCLGLVIKVDGHYPDGGSAPMIPYCFPLPSVSPKSATWAFQETLKYYYTGGAGTLQMGMVPADVAKVVAHVDGLAPVAGSTFPAPGIKDMAFYFLPIPKDDLSFRVSFDEYDAKGVKIGSFNNWTQPPGVPAGSTSHSK